MVVWKAMLGAGTPPVSTPPVSTPPVYAELINTRSDLQQGMVVWKAMLGAGEMKGFLVNCRDRREGV